MSDDMTTEALCWDLNDKVPAQFAHTRTDLSYYCPEKTCLCWIVPAISTRDNYFFRAPGRHVPGCVNEKEVNEPSAKSGIARVKPPHVAAPVIPTRLGAPPIVHRRRRPTVEELRALAEQCEATPVFHPGTFAQVVDAWVDMGSGNRRQYPLSIAGHDRSYHDAFFFLANPTRNIADLSCQERVIFGAAEVENGDHCFFVKTVKKFTFGDKMLRIRADIKKGSPAADELAALVKQSATLFWHGFAPVIDANQTYFVVKPTDDDPYRGALVTPGHLLP